MGLQALDQQIKIILTNFIHLSALNEVHCSPHPLSLCGRLQRSIRSAIWDDTQCVCYTNSFISQVLECISNTCDITAGLQYIQQLCDSVYTGIGLESPSITSTTIDFSTLSSTGSTSTGITVSRFILPI
jgi:hypothetical protein